MTRASCAFEEQSSKPGVPAMTHFLQRLPALQAPIRGMHAHPAQNLVPSPVTFRCGLDSTLGHRIETKISSMEAKGMYFFNTYPMLSTYSLPNAKALRGRTVPRTNEKVAGVFNPPRSKIPAAA